MAAMFQAQTANWEETQEKMSQLVSPLLRVFFVICSSSMSHIRDLFFFYSASYSNSATRIYNQNPRGTGFARGGGKPHTPHQHQPQHQQPDRPLPPSYVCYRCGQKGLQFVRRITPTF